MRALLIRIIKELVAIKKELQNIRSVMESNFKFTSRKY